MAERYTRVFTLQGSYYSPGAPVVIEAGALLKDNQTGNILAQLKFESVSPNTIIALAVRIHAQDVSGQLVDGVDKFQYLDLKINRGETFGQKVAVPMPNATTRKFSCECTSVVFANGDTWRLENEASWFALPTKVTLDKHLGRDLAEQYRRDTMNRANFVPAEYESLWYCTCGARNQSTETACYQCRWNKAALFSALDRQTLQNNKAKHDKMVSEQKAKEAEEKAIAAEHAKKQRAKTRKVIIAVLAAVIILISAVFVGTQIVVPSQRYEQAEELLAQGYYDEAISVFKALGDYSDSASRIKDAEAAKEEAGLAAQYAQGELLYKNREFEKAALVFSSLAGYRDAQERCLECWKSSAARKTICAGINFTVGLKTDGTVIAAGTNTSLQCNVRGWSNIVSVSAGASHTVGLRADGTVVATGNNQHRQCNVSGWTRIVSISAGASHTVGLRADGTVVAVGDNQYKQCNVSAWTDIIAISAGAFHTVGLRADGTVVAVGNNSYNECDVSGWTDIVAISTKGSHTVGLRADGTVVAVGSNVYQQCEVSNWNNIVMISAGSTHTIGLKADGTVVAVGRNDANQSVVSAWTDIVAVSAGKTHTVALKADGTVVTVGDNSDGQCNVGNWKQIKIPE